MIDIGGRDQAIRTLAGAKTVADLAATRIALPAGGEVPTSKADYCRVQGTSRPTADSEIRFELWIPSPSDWNGKFDFLKDHCQVIYLPRTQGISSTSLKALGRALDKDVLARLADAQTIIGELLKDFRDD